MADENIRVYDLAKELDMPNKDLIDKINGILKITIKSHSSVLTPSQVRQIKLALAEKTSDAPKKPKAFIVKKVKKSSEEVEETKKEEEKPSVIAVPKSDMKIGKIEQPKIFTSTPKAPKTPKKDVEKVEKQDKKEVAKEVAPKYERPQNLGRVVPASEKLLAEQKAAKKAEKLEKAQKGEKTEKKFDKKPAQNKENEVRKPISRHVISQDIYENKGTGKRKDKKKEKVYKSKEEEQERISLEKAMAQKHKKHVREEVVEEKITSVVINAAMTVGELADKIKQPSSEIVKFLMMQGVFATVNQVIDQETCKKVCENFELEVLEEDLEAFIQEEMKKEERQKAISEADAKLLKRRAPVVSIMGHVDHGKTTLLDSIRASKHKIAAGEVGGITQSIGAYTVNINNKKIVFVDTPGHEAFTEMRARGAKATDIAILVVAADDGVMPQTVEAINHAKAAEVPIIIAVNKVDKPGADPDRILQQLTEHGLVPEAWGGDTICCKVSALQGTGIDELLEYILLVAEMEDLKANPSAPASGVIIEANLDKGKGPVATLLVQNGTLKIGNCVVCGTVSGKIRALLSDSGERVKEARPSTPVEILGLTEVPQAGEIFEVVENEKVMRAIVQENKQKDRQNKLEAMLPAHARSEAVSAGDDVKNLNLIIKANTHGAAEAVSQAIAQIESKEIFVKIVHVGVGDISEADVMLANASNAIILGFTVKEDVNAMAAAERQGVKIKKYDIIYQILEDIEQTMLSLLAPEIKEVELGIAEVRQVFTVGKTTRIAGCYVLEGKVVRGKTAVVIRNKQEIFKGEIDQLKRFKDDVKEVQQGYECGISFAKFNDLQEGDLIEISTTEEVERLTLV